MPDVQEAIFSREQSEVPHENPHEQAKVCLLRQVIR